MLFNYTTELKTIFENLPINDDPKLSHAQVIENGRKDLFDFDYPIFDPDYKKVFETHFIRNFYVRQIGFETYGLFKFQLETWLIINMPYYNKLFESELLTFDPLSNTKVDQTHKQTTEKDQNDTKTEKESKAIESETNETGLKTGTKTSSDTGSSTTAETETVTGEGESNGKRSEDRSSTASTETHDVGTEAQSKTDTNFNRQLESNTPDSRLTITTEDGSGVIEYASLIRENTEKNNTQTNVTRKNDGTENAESSETRTETLSNTDKTNSNTVGNSTTNTQNDGSVNTTDNETSKSETDLTQNTDKTDSLVSKINTVEDYISSRYGKIGVQSYSKMLIEFRETFMRIERQIFNEMNELFMLVY